MSDRRSKKIPIEGKWLKEALANQGVTAYKIAKQMGLDREKFYRHIRNETYLSSESLAELARALPQLNIRHVLTGSGLEPSPGRQSFDLE